MQDITILSQNLCHHGLTNIYAFPQVSVLFKMVILIWCHFFWKYHPFKQSKKKLTYVGCHPWSYCFVNAPIKFVHTMCCIQLDVWFKSEAITPKSFGCFWLHHLNSRSFLQLLYLSFCCIQPWDKWLSLPQMASGLLKLSIDLTLDPLLGIVTIYCSD